MSTGKNYVLVEREYVPTKYYYHFPKRYSRAKRKKLRASMKNLGCYFKWNSKHCFKTKQFLKELSEAMLKNYD